MVNLMVLHELSTSKLIGQLGQAEDWKEHAEDCAYHFRWESPDVEEEAYWEDEIRKQSERIADIVALLTSRGVEV